jgi:hypothetical protein
MKKLIAIGLLTTSLAFADSAPQTELTISNSEPVKNSCGYVSLGLGPFPIPMPIFGIGGRFQSGHHGADISLQGISFGSGFTVLKENIDYLYYFKPKLSSQFYIGGGISATEVISHKNCQSYLSPQILIGKQYTNKDGDVRFFQAQIEPVFLDLNKLHRKQSWGTFPAVVLSYGICF